MEVEVGTLITPWGVRENEVLEVAGSGSIYGETAITPGFSDAHAHPQVVDVGVGRWRNAYEWIGGRKLRIDEASLRADTELSSRLAAAAMLEALLEGVTLMALVGSAEANVRAYRRLPVKPRLVVMPTVMDVSRGWPSTHGALNLVVSLAALDGRITLGIFIHSLRFATRESLKMAYELSKRSGIPLGIHLSEGVDELPKLAEVLGLREGEDSGIIAVHCIEGSGYRRYGIRVVHCPSSNLRLYGRTVNDLDLVDALGSDWPLLLGSSLSSYRRAVEVHGRARAWKLIQKATVGGYEVYGIHDWKGDVAIFDEPLSRVLEGACRPRFVAVNGKLVVEEGELVEVGLGEREVRRLIKRLIGEALERHSA